jgi:putative ABC transport system permease protein
MIIAFGIMALVGILTAIDSVIYSMSDNFSRMGANSFEIDRKGSGVSGNRGGRRSKRGEPITFREAMEFKERYDFPARVAISAYGTGSATAKFASEKTNPNVRLEGVDENSFYVKGYEIEHGREFSNTEIKNGSNVAIIGIDIVKTLFDDKPELSLNKVIALGNIKYKVIGVLKSKGSSMQSSSDRVVFAPLLNVKRFYGYPEKNYDISVGVRSAEELDNATAAATGVFRNIRGLKLVQENDFEIKQSDSLAAILRENTFKLRMGTIAIGLITLLGAAIGLMNIMLVSVTERTREIGICKALGATRRNILVQFITEAVVICQMGGIIGIVLGILMGNIVTYFLGGSFLVPWAWITLGFVTCLFVGLISGLYPALKAARLDPIESLRYE